MKNSYVFVFFCFVFVASINAQIQKEDVLFTVDNTPVLASKFLTVYFKNLDLVIDESQKNVDEYLKLFINFKLKLIEAKALQLNQEPKYIKEFEGYKKQLAKNYLTNHEATNKLVIEAYKRLSYDVKASHILVKIPEQEQDTTYAYSKILDLRKRLLNQSFESLKKEVHNGRTIIAEDLGYFTAFKMVYNFETVAYNTKIGEVSLPFRTPFGFHIVKVFDKRKSRGEVTVKHIMVSHKAKDSLLNSEARINKFYKLLLQGENFESLAKQFSDDKNSGRNGGELKPFKSGQLRSKKFEDLAFSLKNTGDISKPFKTKFGWHIVKLISKKPMASFEVMQFDLKARVRRDKRSKLIYNSMISTLKKKYNIIDVNPELVYFSSIINDGFFTKSWEIPIDLDENKHFLTIGKQQFFYKDFAKFLFNSQKKTIVKMPIKEVVEARYNAFLNSILLAYHEENLEFENLEYAEVLNEYRDGLLLFNLMEAKIWNVVKEDSVGLKNYFNNNRDNYFLQHRLDATIATSTKEKVIKRAQKMLKRENSLLEIKTKLNQKDAIHIIFTNGIINTNDQSLPSNFKIQVGVSEIYFHNDAYHVIDVKKILPKALKTFIEAKGKVMSDFQDHIEKLWLQQLNDTYKIYINKNVLEKVKQQINNN